MIGGLPSDIITLARACACDEVAGAAYLLVWQGGQAACKSMQQAGQVVARLTLQKDTTVHGTGLTAESWRGTLKAHCNAHVW